MANRGPDDSIYATLPPPPRHVHSHRAPGTQRFGNEFMAAGIIAHTAVRQSTVMPGFALGRNAIAAYPHRRRQPRKFSQVFKDVQRPHALGDVSKTLQRLVCCGELGVLRT
jgi:hypothetical protein